MIHCPTTNEFGKPNCSAQEEESTDGTRNIKLMNRRHSVIQLNQNHRKNSVFLVIGRRLTLESPSKMKDSVPRPQSLKKSRSKPRQKNKNPCIHLEISNSPSTKNKGKNFDSCTPSSGKVRELPKTHTPEPIGPGVNLGR